MEVGEIKTFYHKKNVEEVSIEELLESLTMEEAKEALKMAIDKKAKAVPSTRCLAITKKGEQYRNKVFELIFCFILLNR